MSRCGRGTRRGRYAVRLETRGDVDPAAGGRQPAGASRRNEVMKPKLLSALQALALLFCAPAAQAQNYPVRPLRFLIPFPPGGGADSLARIVGAVAGESLGQQIVIDNRIGAGGNIAAEAAAKAAPDGYTLLQSNISHVISASLYRKLDYDIVRDFVPVTLM